MCIDKFTKIFHDKLKIGREEEWQKVVAINQLVDTLTRDLKTKYREYQEKHPQLTNQQQQCGFRDEESVVEMLKDIDEIIEVFDKLGLSPKSKLLEGRKAFEETVPKIVDALSALVGAATDSTNDILEVLRMLAYIKSAFPREPTLEHAIGRALTLAFSSKPQIRNGIDKFFSETYFNKKDLTEESINRIAKLVQDAKVTDLVCIEEIMPRCARDKDNLEKTALMVEQLLCEFENSPERLILYMIRLLKNDNFQMI